jgi:hypothetical protein
MYPLLCLTNVIKNMMALKLGHKNQDVQYYLRGAFKRLPRKISLASPGGVRKILQTALYVLPTS